MPRKLGCRYFSESDSEFNGKRPWPNVPEVMRQVMFYRDLF
jgi:hypothetical protein